MAAAARAPRMTHAAARLAGGRLSVVETACGRYLRAVEVANLAPSCPVCRALQVIEKDRESRRELLASAGRYSTEQARERANDRLDVVAGG